MTGAFNQGQLFERRLSRKAFLAAAAGVTIVPVLSSLGCGGSSEADSASSATGQQSTGASGSLTLGVFQNPGNLDPGGEGIIVDVYITDNIFDRLVYHFAGSDEYWPGLATQWAISPDATKYTFTLREGVKFHDGTPFDANAVKATFDHIVDPATQARAPLAQIGPYQGTRVVDEFTAEVTFDRPHAAFLNVLTTAGGGISSPAALKEYGPVEYGRHPTGTGPFMFKEWETDQRVVLVRNPEYNWAPEFYKRTGPGSLTEMTFRILPDPGARANALRTGEIDVAEALNAQDARGILEDEGFAEYGVEATGMPYSMPINVTRMPTDDLTVRKALLHGTNQESIVETLFLGIYTAAHQVVTTVTPGYDASLDALYPYDPAAAETLLDEAGWQRSGSGAREKNGQKLQLEIINIANFGFSGIAQLLQAQWKDIGIEAVITEQAFPGVATTMNQGAHNVGNFFYFDVDSYDLFNAVFGSSQIEAGYNWSHYANPELDAIIAEANATADQDERTSLFEAANRIIMEDAAVVPIYNLRSFWVGRGGIDGLAFTPAGTPQMYAVTGT